LLAPRRHIAGNRRFSDGLARRFGTEKLLLKKNLLVDVVATVLSLTFAEIYSFELRKPPKHDQSDLYHALYGSNDYVYGNLTTSMSVRKSLRRISRWSARAKVVMVFTAVLAAIFIPISLLWSDSKVLVIFNIAAMAASIGSYLFLLVRERI
jgi:hypothetical protein